MKKASPKKASLKRIVLFLAVGALAWVVWIMPEGFPDPALILSPEPSRAVVLISMRSDLEHLKTLEDAYFRDHGEYSGKPEELGFNPSQNVTISIIATPSGWSGAATYQEFPRDFGCAVFEGSGHPPPTPVKPSNPGQIECSEEGT